MKRMFLRLFKIGVILVLLFYLGFYLYFQFGWRNYYSKHQVATLITNINRSPALSDSFYIIYDQLYKDRHERITTRYSKEFWTYLLMLKYPLKNNWQYVVGCWEPIKGYRYGLAPMTLAFRINKDATPEKCFDYEMTDRYSLYCKKFKIVDTITNLKSQEEIIKFIVANERPGYYRGWPTVFKRETDSIKNVLGLKQ